MTQDKQVRCITIYIKVLHGYKRFCCIRYTASTNSAYYSILYLYTQTNHVCDLITLNYTSVTLSVGIYQGTVAFYRDLTRITVRDIKSEWISHHYSGNNNRKNDTGLTGTMRTLRYISKQYTVTNCSAAFVTHQLRIPHIKLYYLRRHILSTLVTILHLTTPA